MTYTHEGGLGDAGSESRHLRARRHARHTLAELRGGKGGKVEKNISLPRRASLSRRALALAVAGTGPGPVPVPFIMPQVEQSWLELRGAQEDLLDEKADAAAHRALVESIATGGALAMFDRNSFVDESCQSMRVLLWSVCLSVVRWVPW